MTRSSAFLFGLIVLPLLIAAFVYLSNLNIIFGIVVTFAATSAIVLLFERSPDGASQVKWLVESAFEISAVIGLVASVTAAVPIYDQSATLRQRQSAMTDLLALSMAAPPCLAAQDLDWLRGRVAALARTEPADDASREWKPLREALQQKLRACEPPSPALSNAVATVNAYTKSISDHEAFGAVRSSLSVLNDIKVSVFFSVCVIFYLCHSLWLKIIKAAWIGRSAR